MIILNFLPLSSYVVIIVFTLLTDTITCSLFVAILLIVVLYISSVSFQVGFLFVPNSALSVCKKYELRVRPTSQSYFIRTPTPVYTNSISYFVNAPAVVQ